MRRIVKAVVLGVGIFVGAVVAVMNTMGTSANGPTIYEEGKPLSEAEASAVRKDMELIARSIRESKEVDALAKLPLTTKVGRKYADLGSEVRRSSRESNESFELASERIAEFELLTSDQGRAEYAKRIQQSEEACVRVIESRRDALRRVSLFGEEHFRSESDFGEIESILTRYEQELLEELKCIKRLHVHCGAAKPQWAEGDLVFADKKAQDSYEVLMEELEKAGSRSSRSSDELNRFLNSKLNEAMSRLLGN